MTIINTRVYKKDIGGALACKCQNKTLSSKTLKKLTKIANKQFGGDTTRVFGNAPGLRFNGDAVGLRKVISRQLNSVTSPAMDRVMRGWLERLPAPLLPEARLGSRGALRMEMSSMPASAARGVEPTYCEIPDVPRTAQRHGSSSNLSTASPLVRSKSSEGVEIPVVDYEKVSAVVIPEPDYDVVPAPVIPRPDYYRVSFSDSVEDIPPQPADAGGDRKGEIERNTEAQR